MRDNYDDAMDEKDDFEIRLKESELKIFLLEEQLRSDGQMPLTQLPEALTPDNSEEMDALRKKLRDVTAVRNDTMRRADEAENEVHMLQNTVQRLQAAAKGDPTQLHKLSSKVEETLAQMADLQAEMVRAKNTKPALPLLRSAPDAVRVPSKDKVTADKVALAQHVENDEIKLEALQVRTSSLARRLKHTWVDMRLLSADSE